VFRKNYVPPTLMEGFQEIVEINFIPKFHSEQDRTLYEMYLLES
jgi:bifunctional polynucleotide phosphatase/kinase